MSILKYKGYEGTADIDMTAMICRGKILFIADLVTYQAPDPVNLQKEFEAAVEDYLETCEYLGRSPHKPLKGLFNVRVSPDLHRLAVVKATDSGTSLNKIVAKSLESYLSGNNAVAPNITINMATPEKLQTLAVSPSTEPVWEDSVSVY